MDQPGIETLAGLWVGIVLGSLFTATGAAHAAAGDARLRAAVEERAQLAATAARVLADREGVRIRLLVGRVLTLGLVVAYAVQSDVARASDAAMLAVVGGTTFAYGFAAEAAAAVARRRASRVALRLLWLVRPLDLLLAPLAWPLTAIAKRIERWVPAPVEPESPRITELAVEEMIERSKESGSLADEQVELIRSVVEFRNTMAREVMVPRTEMVAFEIGMPIDDVLRAIIESGHSRYPVYRDQVDQVEGVLHAKDLFRALHAEEARRELTIASVMRTPVFFAVETQKIDAVLREMQARRSHLAIVVDEFGGVSGLVTLEDVLEELVGEIQDEHDEEEPLVHQLGPDHYEVDAGISVYDLEQILGAKLGSESGDFDSLGGLIIAVAGRVPPEGDRVALDGYELIVLEADERRVIRVELLRRATDPGASGDEAQAAAG